MIQLRCHHQWRLSIIVQCIAISSRLPQRVNALRKAFLACDMNEPLVPTKHTRVDIISIRTQLVDQLPAVLLNSLLWSNCQASVIV